MLKPYTVETLPDTGQLDLLQDAELYLINLFNTFETLVSLLYRELQHGSMIDAFLIVAGLSQIVADYLHGDLLFLGKISKHLERKQGRVGRQAAKRVWWARHVLGQMQFYKPSRMALLNWQRQLDSLTESLALAVVSGAPPGSVSRAELLQQGEELRAGTGRLPKDLLNKIVRLPSAFRSFDQHPADYAKIARDFSAKNPDRSEPLLVVGIRTSGSYLAPLCRAFLRKEGYHSVETLTIRPGRVLLRAELDLLKTVAGAQKGRVILVDDPPSTGDSFLKAALDLEKNGVPRDRIILFLPLFGGPDTVPARLSKYAAIKLPWEEWQVTENLKPSAVRNALGRLLGSGIEVGPVEKIPAVTASRQHRGHAQALYRVEIRRDGEESAEEIVQVRGTGLGYFGRHNIAVWYRLQNYFPAVYGWKDGLIYTEGLQPGKSYNLAELPRSENRVNSLVQYIVARNKALPTGRDYSLQMVSQKPVWQIAGDILRWVFGYGKAGLLARPLAYNLAQRLLRVDNPSVIDGCMQLEHWYLQGKESEENNPEESKLIKTRYATGAFSNHDHACYDPVYDLTGLALDFELRSLETGREANLLPAGIRGIYEAESGTRVEPERWLLYQQVYLQELADIAGRTVHHIRRAQSRVYQRYFSEVFFEDLPSPGKGPLCAIDIDGVLETEPFGFPVLTPAGARALRALQLHGYRPLLVTGRSLPEVKERCRAYNLAGGVAEYGAVAFNHLTQETTVLLTEAQQEALENLRAKLRKLEGVFVNEDYRFAVRAFRYNSSGATRPLKEELVKELLQESGPEVGLRAIKGECQTDFMVAGIDKGSGLKVLAKTFGVEGDRVAALAVGDTISDLAMFKVAENAAAPANADKYVREAGITIMKQRYQGGLSEAVAGLLTHRPAGCPVCREPAFPPGRDLFLSYLATANSSAPAKVRQAIRLAVKQFLFRDSQAGSKRP